jgi:hypothetical protein
MHTGLQIAVEVLIRVQFRRIGREVEKFDLMFFSLQPFLDLLGVMDTQVISELS